MKAYLNSFLTAVSHLTISRKSGYNKISNEEIRQSLLFFPLVGFYIGLLLFLINSVAGSLLPGQIVDIFLILFLLAFTGAKHLKALLSMFTGTPGLSGTRPIPSSFEFRYFLILFFILMLKFLLLNSIVPGWKNAVLLIMPVFGRWSLIFFPYLQATRTGEEKDINPLYGEISIKDFWVGTITASFLSLLFLGVNGIIIFMMIIFAAIIIERLYQEKTKRVAENLSLGIVEITEMATLFFFVVLESGSREIVSNSGVLV